METPTSVTTTHVFKPFFYFDIPDHDMPTCVNHLNTGTMHDYWSCDADVITVNTVDVDKDDPTVI